MTLTTLSSQFHFTAGRIIYRAIKAQKFRRSIPTTHYIYKRDRRERIALISIERIAGRFAEIKQVSGPYLCPSLSFSLQSGKTDLVLEHTLGLDLTLLLSIYTTDARILGSLLRYKNCRCFCKNKIKFNKKSSVCKKKIWDTFIV